MAQCPHVADACAGGSLGPRAAAARSLRLERINFPLVPLPLPRRLRLGRRIGARRGCVAAFATEPIAESPASLAPLSYERVGPLLPPATGQVSFPAPRFEPSRV